MKKALQMIRALKANYLLGRLFLLVWLVGLTACQSQQAAQGPLPTHLAYVLAGKAEYNNFRNNALTLVDTDSWQVYKRIALPHSRAESFSRDPQGRIWIGFSGNTDRGDNRVQIYSSDGELLTTLTVCQNPEVGISFAADRAFIACTENGFMGKITVVNLKTLTTEKEITLAEDNQIFLLLSSASNEHAVVASGLTRGPKEDATYCFISIIDPVMLTLRKTFSSLENCNIATVMPSQDNFYLLNPASSQRSRTEANDILIVQSSNPFTLTEQNLAAPSPLWGTIVSDTLYTFHNPTWNATNMDPKRTIARLDLKTGETRSWPLPDLWNAEGITVINDQIILSNWWPDDSSKDGLYLFDPTTGALTQKVNIVGAEKILTVP